MRASEEKRDCLENYFIFSMLCLFCFSCLLLNFLRHPKQLSCFNKSYFWRGVMISSLNIFPIPYFLILSTLFTPTNQIGFSLLTKFIFALSAAIGSMATFMGYVYFFDKIIKQNDIFKQYSNYFMAALMLCLLVVTLFRIYG